MNKEQISTALRTFILEKFPLARRRGIDNETFLLQSGIVDSLGILELVAFVENEFAITISDDELMPENFQNISMMTSFIASKAIANRVQNGPVEIVV
jgi:acyl carrier protein